MTPVLRQSLETPKQRDRVVEIIGLCPVRGAVVAVEDADFEAVRGTYDTNKFVKQIIERKKKIEETHGMLTGKL